MSEYGELTTKHAQQTCKTDAFEVSKSKSIGLNHAGDTTHKSQSYPNSTMTKIL